MRDRHPTQCWDNPSALEVEALYPAIVRLADCIVASELFLKNGNLGLIIVQGKHVLTDTLLYEAAGELTFWLNQDDLDLCKLRHLKARGFGSSLTR